jgi:hypothetical protein
LSIKIIWDNPQKTVLYINFDGDWGWTDYDSAIDELHNKIREVDHVVDILSYMPPGKTLPPGPPLNHLRRAFQLQPDNAGYSVFIGGTTFGDAIVAVFSKMNKAVGEKIKVAETIEEGRALIVKLRSQENNQ